MIKFRYNALMLLAVVAIVSAATPSTAAVRDFLGRWTIEGSGGRGIVRLSIRMDFGRPMIRSWARCRPRLCDWGRSPAVAFGPSPRARAMSSALLLRTAYRTGSGRRVLILRKAGLNRLRVLVLTRFTDGSGRANFVRRYVFRRAGPGGPGGPPGGPVFGAETCFSFNPNALRVQAIGGGFTLAAPGRRVLERFGPRFFQALRGLQIVRYYRFNRRCTVGRPGASMVYWLRGATAPVGRFAGEDCVRFNPNRTGVVFAGGGWVVVQGSRRLFRISSRREGLRALGVLRRYRFTKSCFVGRPQSRMSYLRR